MAERALKDGYIFDIQGFSVHDGPGCRTLIFMKGCPLQCSWCSNPEGIFPFPEPLYDITKCHHDSLCIEACPHSAVRADGDGLAIDKQACAACTTQACAAACCSGALRIAGYRMSADKLYEKIQRDRRYWGSGGGITFTGGEPFLQPDFVREVLARCYDAYIHTSVETCGLVPWDSVERSLPYLEWIFFDLKHMHPEKHRAMTGASNTRVLENAKRLATQFNGRLIFRIPLVPGYNDTPENISQVIDFLNLTGRKEVNLLPLHHLGREKYRLLGKEYYTGDFKSPGKEILERIGRQFDASGIHCYLGSETPF